MIQVRFEFPCGTIKFFLPATQEMRGIQVKGKRPTYAVIFDDNTRHHNKISVTELLRKLLPVMSASERTIIVDISAEYLFSEEQRAYLEKYNGKTDTES